MVTILLILITSSHDSVWILLGENCCWSLLGLKGLIVLFCVAFKVVVLTNTLIY